MVSTTAPAKRECSVFFPWFALGVLVVYKIAVLCFGGYVFYLKRKMNANKEKSEKKESTTTTDVGETGNQQ